MRFAVIIASLVASQVAVAGAFGGFSADESKYLEGRDRVCTPLTADATGEPVCTKAEARELAKQGFRRPPPVRAGVFKAAAIGTRIEVVGADGRKLRTWTASGVVSRVSGVYVSTKGRMVAVEYEARVFGRVTTAVVGFALPKASHVAKVGGGQAQGTIKNVATGPSGKVVSGRIKRDKSLQRKLQAARKLVSRRRYAAAKKSYEGLMNAHSADAAVVYGMAAASAGLGAGAEAVAFLRKLGKLDHAEVPIWMVEARTDAAFNKLRADSAFRRAIGLDPGERSLSAYERAVGLGGVWEQSGSPCAEPRVELRLSRAKQTFRLTIASDCQGMTDRTRLAGRWTTQGGATLTLIFPNPGQDDETLVCELRPCDGGQETCSDCGADTDMGFLLRPTRR